MKKSYLLMLIVIAGIWVSGSRQALAATGLSEAEELILDKLRAGIEIDGELRYIPASYLNQIENELIRNKTDLTTEQAGIAWDKLTKVLQYMEDMNIRDITNIESSETAFKLLSLISEAASEIGYSVSIDLTDRTVNVENPEGEAVLIAKNTINQTGFDLRPVLMVGAMLLSVFLVCLLAYVRWNMLAKNMSINHQQKEALQEEPEDKRMERMEEQSGEELKEQV